MGKEMQRAETFARELAELYRGELVSVVLYGSAARGEYREGSSDLNILVLLREATPSMLRRGSALARGWVAEGNPPPLMLGAEEMRRSLDVFPIEYSDIRDGHRVLHGEDPFAGLEIDSEHLRLQCEHEIKGKQIQLREGYLLSAEEPEELGTLLLRSFPTFLVLFRTVLRLTDSAAAQDAESVITQMAERVGFSPDALREIHQARSRGQALRPDPAAPVVIGYLEAVARTVEFVDRLGEKGRPATA
jgi:predicted nucleotidyltransferase